MVKILAALAALALVCFGQAVAPGGASGGTSEIVRQETRYPVIRYGGGTATVGAVLCWDAYGRVKNTGCTVSGSGETNTASNLGSGTGIYGTKSGVDLQFKSLVAGSNKLSISATSTEITLDVNQANLSLSSIGGSLGLGQIAQGGATSSQVLAWNGSAWAPATPSGGSGAVDSVNGATGVVVLDADDIDDAATTHKFVTAADLTKLSNLSGTNTGDQTTITGNAGTASALAANPADCGAGTKATAIAANGDLTCSAVSLTADVSGILPNVNTTAASTNTASAIVTRDASGNFAAGTITAALTGNASTASALAANPSDCGAGTKATAIAASGDLTCSAVSLTADVSGTLPVANGGTGLSSGTSGGVPYFSASGTIASSGALTANLPVIGGGAGSAPTVGTRSGNTTAFVTTTGAQTSGDCVEIDANGNHVASGAACGTGGGSGNGALILVEEKTASSSASLDFTSCFTSTYDNYLIQIQDLLPATDGAALAFRVSTDGGSSYVSSSSYQWTNHLGSTSAGAVVGSASATLMAFTFNQSADTALYGFSGNINAFNPRGSSLRKIWQGSGMLYTSADIPQVVNFFGVYAATTAVTAFQILADSGNLASGKAYCYAYAKTGSPGGGDVTGPASATSGNIPTFSGTTGKIIQDGGKALPSGSVVGTSDTQTLTAKTLTTPIFTGYTVAGLPAAGTAGRIAVVTDAATAGDCDTGSGSALAFCRDSGAAWVPLGDGGGSGGSGDVVGPASSVDGEVALFDSTTGKLLKRASGTGPAKLTSGVLSASAVALASEVSGTLPVANGGTGATTLTAHGVVIGNGTGAVAITGAGTSGQALVSNGASADPTFQTLTKTNSETYIALASSVGNQFNALGTGYTNPSFGSSTNPTRTNFPLEPTAGSPWGVLVQFRLPSTWQSSGSTVFTVGHYSGSTINSRTLSVEGSCVGSGDVGDAAPTWATAQTTTFTPASVNMREDSITLNSTTLSGCSAGDLLYLRFTRTDANAGTVRVRYVALSWVESL